MQPDFKPSDREEVSINQQEDMPEKQAATLCYTLTCLNQKFHRFEEKLLDLA